MYQSVLEVEYGCNLFHAPCMFDMCVCIHWNTGIHTITAFCGFYALPTEIGASHEFVMNVLPCFLTCHPTRHCWEQMQLIYTCWTWMRRPHPPLRLQKTNLQRCDWFIYYYYYYYYYYFVLHVVLSLGLDWEIKVLSTCLTTCNCSQIIIFSVTHAPLILIPVDCSVIGLYRLAAAAWRPLPCVWQNVSEESANCLPEERIKTSKEKSL